MLNPSLEVRQLPQGVELFDTTQNISLPLFPHQKKILDEILRTRIIDQQFASFFINYNFFIRMEVQ